MPMICHSINQALFERIAPDTRSLLDVVRGGGTCPDKFKVARSRDARGFGSGNS
jgi:hypothetical protein